VVRITEDDHLISAGELANWLGIPVPTIYRWRVHGQGPKAARVGRHLRYRVGDVKAWLEQQTEL
jgi:excisionase family DNA binding protein